MMDTKNEHLFSHGIHDFNGYDGTPLKYHVQGSGALVILQAGGWGITNAYLRTGLSPLANEFTLLCMDTRGSGESSQPSNAANMSDGDMTEDLESLRQHLHLERFERLLGHSQGGSVALLYAERYPMHVNKLILLAHKLVGYDGGEMTSFIKQRRHDPLYAKVIERIDGPQYDPVEQHREWVAYMYDFLQLYVTHPPTQWPTFAAVMGTPSGWTNKAWMRANDLKKDDVDTYSRLANVKAKTLCLGCDEDPVCTVHETRVTHAGIENADVYIFKDCGHFPWIEHPLVFFQKVQEFFK